MHVSKEASRKGMLSNSMRQVIQRSDAWKVIADEAERARKAYKDKHGEDSISPWSDVLEDVSRHDDIGLTFNIWRTFDGRAIFQIKGRKAPYFLHAFLLKAENETAWTSIRTSIRSWIHGMTEKEADNIRNLSNSVSIPGLENFVL